MVKRIGFFSGWLAVALVVFAFSAPEAGARGMIQVKGSDSEVNLVQRLAEVFMQKTRE